MSWTDIAEYESLRVKEPVHTGRHGLNPKMVTSGPGLTIVLSQRDGTPYVCWRIPETGLEIPVENVTSAIPKGVSLAAKLRKTTAQGRLTPKLPAKTKAPKDVPRKVRGHDGEMVVQPKRRAGQTPSIVGPAPGVRESDGED